MKTIRSFFAFIFRRAPMFTGKGRLVLLLDSLLSRTNTLESHFATGEINSLARMHFDLRPWGQKFAYYYGEWELEYINLARALYRGGVFIDVGSSIGLYVICFGDLVRNAGCKIASIEPVEFNLVKQKENVSLNGFDAVVEYFPLAVGESESVIRITADPDGRDNNAYVSDTGSIEVAVTTLDILASNESFGRVGFIKIDVEGYEPMVMAGARKMIANDKPVIFAEFNRERMLINGFEMDASWQFLMGQGYRAYRVLDGKLTLMTEPFDYENIFFVPAEVDVPKVCLV